MKAFVPPKPPKQIESPNFQTMTKSGRTGVDSDKLNSSFLSKPRLSHFGKSPEEREIIKKM